MKILLVSPHGDGAWFTWLFRHAGHQSDWYLLDEKYASYDGIVDRLKKKPNFEAYDLVVFDDAGEGKAADQIQKVTPVIGGSELSDRLEDDRLFGLEVMEKVGIRVPAWEVFDSPEKGIAWLEKNNKRTVFKPIGDDILDKSTTYVSKSSEDMIRFMDRVFKKAKIKSYILQEVVGGGTETACGGWFNGEKWIAVDHNIELKKQMNGDIGPNTGCAGSLMWMPPKPTPLFQQGLDKVSPFLADAGFVGLIDLNTIVTEGVAYGIEWTPRFGYESTCNFTRLLPMEFGEFLGKIARGEDVTVGAPKSRFSATTRVSVPPYPNAAKSRTKDRVPILGIDIKKLEHFFLADVQMNSDGCLETTGNDNNIGSPIGVGDSICEAFEEVEGCIKGLNVPDLMYRTDVRECIEKRYCVLERQGWLRPIG